MPDPIRLITRRLAAMTYDIVDGQAQFIWGRVLGRNPDGTLNIDDGKGGCVLVVPPMNARTGDVVQVDLGAMIGGIGMPGVATYTASVPQTNHQPTLAIIDDAGNIYSEASGTLVGSGGTPTADVDPAFGYYHYVDPWPYPITHYLLWAGAEDSYYHDAQIGSLDMTTGYQGESFSANNTVLCAGLGSSAGILCGAEHANLSGGHDPRWVINLRNASTFDLIASNAADYIADWMDAHPDTFWQFPDQYDTYDVHISPDPIDGSFWVNLRGGVGTPKDPAPMFNVSASDGSLIRTISLAVPNQFFKRAHRVQPE